jgi:hypothetical protein
MILHLLFDSQFSDYVIEQFTAEEMQSDFVLVTSTQDMRHFKLSFFSLILIVSHIFCNLSFVILAIARQKGCQTNKYS